MKKRLLLAFMAMSAAVSGYALEQGEFVYTPQGRFKITGANVNANNAFQTMDGWTVVSATEKTLDDNFIINANGYAEGFNSVVSTASTAGEGMYYKFEPSDAGASYVVSIKMKGAALVTTRTSTEGFNGSNASLGDVLKNGVKISGNSENVYGSSADELIVNKGEELTDEWQTFNYAIVGDGTPRTYFISFTHMDINVEIADLQIAPAMQFADLRQRDAMLEKLNVYKNCYAWSEALLEEYAVTEGIANLEAIGDESGQDALNEALSTAQEILDEFIKANMDDYLADNNDNYLGTTPSAGVNKGSAFGAWNCTTTGRAFWSNGNYAELGHYQKGSKWNYGNTTSAMGIYMNRNLTAGSYVFSVEANAAMREDATQSWYINEGLKPAYGVFSIVKCYEGTPGTESTDTLVSVVKDLDPVKFTPFIASAKIEAEGTYEVSLKAYCKEAYQDQLWGSVVYVRDASIYGKNENVYNQKQLSYETDVREQITTGRDALTKAAEYLGNADYFWGKADLQECATATEPKIEAYEAMSQDEIIATFDETSYVKENRTKNAEEGLLVFQVYDEAVKGILAANKKFLAINDTLNSMQTAIDAAEKTLDLRLYDTATGKDALKDAISKAKGIQTQMKADQYSEENAATIVAANATLNEAVETFKTTIPASSITTIADIDFSVMAVDSVINVDGSDISRWIIAGAVNEMILPNYAEDATGTTYGQGVFNNGERIHADTLRVGNGEAVVNIPAEQQVEGTNILKIEFDYYFGNLVGKYAGFALQNDSATIADFSFSPYDGKASVNTFGLDFSATYMPKVGDRNNSNAAIAAASNKTHFEVIVDYGTKTMYCSTAAAKGSQTTTPVEFDGSKMSKFIVKSDYNNADRRCWFDNLKIQRILAGEAPVLDGISEVNAAAKVKAPTKVLKNGRIIINGKYGINGMLLK